jgi:endonuclease/exonuclease/phosphatase family metal-dependent hydrolase
VPDAVLIRNVIPTLNAAAHQQAENCYICTYYWYTNFNKGIDIGAQRRHKPVLLHKLKNTYTFYSWFCISLQNVQNNSFGPKRDEVTRERRKLHNEELNDLYCSPNIFRVIKSSRRVGHVARMGEKRDVYRVLVGKPEGRRPLERPRRRWEDNIKVDLRQVDVGEWTGSSWLRIGTGGGLL